MSTKEGKGVTREEIQKVQSMINLCLLHYTTRKEATDILYQYRKIEPGLTNTVWKRLEEENPEYFKAYYQRLILCRQMLRFNHLLKKQAAVMDQMKHGEEVATSNGTHMQQMHQVQHPTPTFNAGPSKHSGMQYAYNTYAFGHSTSMWLNQNPNQVAFAPESHRTQMHQVQHHVPRVLPQFGFDNSGPSAHSERPHAYPSNILLAQIPNIGIPSVSDYPYNTLLVQNMDGGMIQGMHNGMNPTAYLVPTNSPEPSWAICGRPLMEHAYGDPLNTLLAQDPTVGIMQGMNNGIISVNNNTTTLGNYGHQIGNSGVRLQAPVHQFSIPAPPPVRNEPCSPGDQHSSNN